MERNRIYIPIVEDRVTVAAILFKAGYAVRTVKVKENNKSVTYLEYWKEV